MFKSPRWAAMINLNILIIAAKLFKRPFSASKAAKHPCQNGQLIQTSNRFQNITPIDLHKKFAEEEERDNFVAMAFTAASFIDFERIGFARNSRNFGSEEQAV